MCDWVATWLLHIVKGWATNKSLKPLLTWLEVFCLTRLVAHTGFEPVISALKGRCPRPLDERGSLNAVFVVAGTIVP